MSSVFTSRLKWNMQQLIDSSSMFAGHFDLLAVVLVLAFEEKK